MENGKDAHECKQVGMSIAKSPLVKTAFFASDPNLGRILSAIGNTNLKELNIFSIDIFINELLFASGGSVIKDYEESKIQKEMMKQFITLYTQ